MTGFLDALKEARKAAVLQKDGVEDVEEYLNGFRDGKGQIQLFINSTQKLRRDHDKRNKNAGSDNSPAVRVAVEHGEVDARGSHYSRSYSVRPVKIDLNEDPEASARLVRAAARRVIKQHKDEIEALAYK